MKIDRLIVILIVLCTLSFVQAFRSFKNQQTSSAPQQDIFQGNKSNSIGDLYTENSPQSQSVPVASNRETKVDVSDNETFSVTSNSTDFKQIEILTSCLIHSPSSCEENKSVSKSGFFDPENTPAHQQLNFQLLQLEQQDVADLSPKDFFTLISIYNLDSSLTNVSLTSLLLNSRLSKTQLIQIVDKMKLLKSSNSMKVISLLLLDDRISNEQRNQLIAQMSKNYPNRLAENLAQLNLTKDEFAQIIEDPEFCFSFKNSSSSLVHPSKKNRYIQRLFKKYNYKKKNICT